MFFRPFVSPLLYISSCHSVTAVSIISLCLVCFPQSRPYVSHICSSTEPHRHPSKYPSIYRYLCVFIQHLQLESRSQSCGSLMLRKPQFINLAQFIAFPIFNSVPRLARTLSQLPFGTTASGECALSPLYLRVSAVGSFTLKPTIFAMLAAPQPATHPQRTTARTGSCIFFQISS